MRDRFDVLVIGAGAFGLATAFELARRGLATAVLDRGGTGASGVAAGMIAPAFEAALDEADAARTALLRDGRRRWDDFAAAAGIHLSAEPAEWRGPGAEEMAARLEERGFQAARSGDRLRVAGDVQLQPRQALAALTRGLERAGGRRIDAEVGALERADGRWAVGGLAADRLVVATGAAPPVAGLPPTAADTVRRVQPIRGQIGLSPERLVDHVVRGRGVYLAPWGEGTAIGATMDAGRRDLEPDPAAAARLLQAAEAVLGFAPDPGRVAWRVGVRGASPDGLPMAGVAADRLFVALAPRRNGWLLAPLAAGIVADAVEGRPATPLAAALDPLRFA